MIRQASLFKRDGVELESDFVVPAASIKFTNNVQRLAGRRSLGALAGPPAERLYANDAALTKLNPY